MKLSNLGGAAVLISSLIGGSAFAGPTHGGAPIYAEPTYAAPTYAPVYSQPVYRPAHAAAPVVTVTYTSSWEREAYERFLAEQARQSRDEEANLYRERANYAARYGWDPIAMTWFDQHQAQERASFEQAQLARRNNYLAQLEAQARNREYGHGRWHHRHHDRDYDYD